MRRPTSVPFSIGLWTSVLLVVIAADAWADRFQFTWQDVFGPRGGRIGVKVQPMTPELREFMKAPADRGVLVAEVAPERPAAAAGLLVGDVITTAAGKAVKRPADLVRSVARVEEGAKLTLEIVRGGKSRSLEVEPAGPPGAWGDPEHLGIWIEQNIRRGGRELQERLEELEDRLEELERRLEDDAETGDWRARRT